MQPQNSRCCTLGPGEPQRRGLFLLVGAIRGGDPKPCVATRVYLGSMLNLCFPLIGEDHALNIKGEDVPPQRIFRSRR